jgi:transcriptional regulator with XRE-family HTH domain
LTNIPVLGKIDPIHSIQDPIMQIPIHSPADLGIAIRAVRHQQGLRLDDTAGSAGVGHVFLREVERGKETVQLGRVLQVLHELGIHLSIDIPSEALPRWEALRQKGLKPLPRRSPARTGNPSGSEQK